MKLLKSLNYFLEEVWVVMVGSVSRDNVMRSSNDDWSDSVVGSVGPSVAVGKVSASVEQAWGGHADGQDEGKHELYKRLKIF